MIQQRHFLFSKKDEIINLGLTLVFLCLALFELFNQKNPFNSFLSHQQQMYIAYVFFLSVAHVAITPVMIYFLPEIKLLNHQQMFRNEMGIKRKMSLFFFVVFVLVLGLELLNIETASKFLLAVLVLGNAWHFISQYVGMSLFYLAKRRSDDQAAADDKNQFDNTRATFKKLIFALFIMSVGYQILVQVFAFGSSPYFATARFILLGAELVCIGTIYFLLFKGLRHDSQLRRQKFVYSLRLFLFPLTLFTMIAGLAVAAIHAVEYILLSRRFMKASAITSPEKKPFYLTALLLIGINLLSYTIVWRQQGHGQLYYAAASAFFLALTFTHFYADRLLFRMKDPLVRELNKKLMG